MIIYDEEDIDFGNERTASHCDKIIKNKKPNAFLTIIYYIFCSKFAA